MTTILLSYNEVQSVTRKAANGAGLPHGVAEDIGLAAVWLSARGVDAIGTVVEAFAEGVEPPQSIFDALAAVDALCSAAVNVVPLPDRASGLLILGLGGTAALDMGLGIALDRGDGDVVPLARLSDATGPIPSVAVLRRLPGEDAATEFLGAPRPAATDAKAYAAALALAARTYVPASELSRTQGAGAGTTDND
ncbi:DUF3726 domain-containing protein [Shinella sp. CPCC 101442]|uniref:DUF3726 domain-containing protein n=1 Tax=Shinella sp. CPCC 101442 TaxID=2932265 RepID=UPI0021520388|nr:DUF3726 domain-containing protein [Shinella sp. CPCC 101442]MCR6502438.1 DUF3726 domain-containing protein [Shinella sp. CPCC 101442]